MSGTYTINPSGSGSKNYKTFGAAVNALNSSGVSGAVVFNVSNGTYTQQIELKYVSGSSSSNTITFNGTDSSKVSLEYDCSQYEAVVKINAAENFVFKNMTIRSTNNTYGYGLHLTSGAKNVSVENCVVRVAARSGVSSECIPINVAGVTSATYGGNGEDVSISDCRIIGGYYGINIRGTNNSLLAKDFSLTNCVLDSQYVYGVYCVYAEDLYVKNNLIDNMIIYYAYAVYTNQCAGSSFIENKIYPGRFGIYLYLENYYNRTDSTVIINNEISDFNDASYQSGIYAPAAYNLRAYHNTISINATVSNFTYSCMYLSGPFNHKVFNNNLNASGNSTCFFLGTGSMGSTEIDHNNYSSNGAGLINWQGTTYNNLASLKVAVSSQNQNSVNENSGLSGSRNLVPTASGLNNKAKKGLASVDLGGNTRPKAPDNTPDIGAYEFYITPADIDLVAIPEPLIAKKGNNQIGVAIKNSGSAAYKDTVFLQYRVDLGSWVKDTAIYTNLKVGEIDTFYFQKKWSISTSGSYSVCVFIEPGITGDPDSLAGDSICDTKCVGRTGKFVIDASGGGDYTTFGAAINSLNCGIDGPIEFEVKPGTYKERLTLSEVFGSSATNTVSFIGTDRDKVIIEYDGTSSNPATVLFDDADYVTFKDITILNEGDQVSCGIWMREESKFNTIDNCKIILDSTAANYATTGILVANAVSSSAIVIPGNQSHDITIQNCEIVGGSHGIRANGSGNTSTSANFRIENNDIRAFYYQGITVAYLSEAIIRRNKVYTPRLYTAMGLSMYYCHKDSIDYNTLEGGRYGMYLYYENSYNRSSFTSVANNMVSNLLDPNYQIGIYSSVSYNTSIYHNSIWTTHSFSNAFYAALNLYYGNNCFVKNNSIKASNGGMCISIYYGTISAGAINNNNYYSEGAAKYYHDGLTFSDLGTWKGVKTKDNTKSKEGDPNYNSILDLHATGDQLNNAAVKNLGITDDFDGDKRPFAPDNKPDIGADEYYVSPYDIDLISLDSPLVPVIGKNDIKIRLRNAGVKSLSDDTIVVSYTVDGILNGRDTVIINALDPGATLIYAFKNQWNISTGKTYQLCAQLDTFYKPDPDSLIKQKKCASMCPGAGGIYSIDASGSGDFKTFNDALNALACGISGKVVFNVKNGTYNERLKINEIIGASEQYQVSFVGESRKGVVMNYTGVLAAMEVVHLEGADYINFSNMTLRNNSTAYSRGVRVSNAADHNSFTNVSFDIPTNANNGNCMSVYISDEGLSTVGNAGNYNVFTNCSLVGGYYGARLYGVGTSSLTYGNEFINCRFSENRFYSIMSYYQGQMVVEGCTFDSLRVAYRNMYLYACSQTRIVGNSLKKGRMGMYLIYENYYFQEESSLITNNMISDLNFSTGECFAMDIYLCYNIGIYHNSISLDDGTGGAAMRFRYGSGTDVRNNSIAKSSDADLFSVLSTAFNEIDFNNYYIGTSKNFANYNGTTYDDLSKWKSGVNGFNRNSREGDPKYRSSTDLRADPQSTQLANWGSTTTGVTTDFEGDVRNPNSPDIGADEYSNLYDVGISAVVSPASGCELSGTETMTITIKNEGSLDIPSGEIVPVNFSINGGTSVLDTIFITSTLSTGSTLNHTFLQKGNFSSIKAHDLDFWTDLSNDPDRTNDSVSVTINSNEFPSTDFSYSNTCTSQDVLFKDLSTIGTSSIATHEWTFGNGKNSNIQNAKTDYTASGAYSVKLKVTSAAGCADSLTQTVDIDTKPSASYTSADLCLGDSTSFTNTSSIVSTVGSTFKWAFGDANTSTRISPKHKYGSSNNYSVELIATSPDGCSDTSTTTITISPDPTSDFGLSNTCKGDSSSFTNNSVIPNGFTPTYSWSFGDGNSSSKESPKYLYGAIGAYNVSLTAALVNGCSSTEQKTINIYSKPQPLFTAADGCEGDSIAFIDASVIQLDTISNYDWDFGDTKTSILENPKHLYDNDGSYSVKLILTSKKGCMDSLSKTVNVNEKPVANFNVSDVCEGESTSFSNSSSIGTGSISTNTWTFGDGFGSTSASPGHTYSANGNYTATLIVGSNKNCSDTISKTTDVNAVPTVDFAVSNVCFGDKLSPTNNSSISGGTISGYTWDFDDGNSSTSASPQHTYTSKGTYDVELLITTTDGCKDSLSKQVVVDNTIVPGFNSTNVCLGDSMAFTNITNTSCGVITNYFWRFGNGNTSILENPKHKYASAGNYDVTLVVTKQGGIKDSIKKTVSVYANPSTGFSLTNACAGSSTSFTNSSSISSGSITGYEWSFGDGFKSSTSTPAHTYATDGSYSVKLVSTSNNGCKDSISKSISIYELPSVDFSVSSVCLGQAVSFSNSSSISSGSLSYSWAFGDGFSSSQTSPSYTYTSSGTFNAKLTATSNNNCVASVTKPLTINPKPTAAFSAADECENKAVIFNNSSTISSGTISHNWNFGDLTSSTSVNPSHQYSSQGSYSVKLKITSNKGCLDSVTKSVRALPAPIANFTVPSPCSGTKLTFSNATSVSAGSLSYAWDLGDGNTSTATSPTHTYTTTGNYTVKLVATASGGCQDSISKSAKVYDLPTASYSVTGGCLDDSIAFANTSNIASGTMTYRWDLGNGKTSTATSVKEKYSASGTYQVKLVVTSNWGCKDSSTQTITINPSPSIAFSVSDGCLGSKSSFVNNSSISVGSLSYFWDFDNGLASTNKNPDITYGTPGTYDVLLTATSGKGCTDSLRQSVEIFVNPMAQFGFNNTCLGDTTLFQNNSTISSGTYASQWDFDNGANSIDKNPKQPYKQTGKYLVELIVISNEGCRDTTYQNVQINPTPSPRFSALNSCFGDAVTFNNNSAISKGAFTSAWTFGDGKGSAMSNPSHTYGSAGSFLVDLVVTSDSGCVATKSDVIVVNEKPSADFTVSNVCKNDNAIFTNGSSIASGKIQTYDWAFGDGFKSTQASPTHGYALSGSYSAVLIVASDSGCTDTVTKSVQVYPVPSVAFTVTNVCFGDTLYPNNTTSISSGTVNHSWTFGDGKSSTSASPFNYYSSKGTYDVKLVSTSNNGCKDSLTKKVTVDNVIIPDFTQSNVCVGERMNFTNTTNASCGNISSYQWQFGDGNNSSQTDPSHVYTGAGSYNVRLIVTQKSGTKDTIIKQVSVYHKPSVSFSARDTCALDTVSFTNNSSISSGAITSYEWDLGDGTKSNGTTPTHQYANRGNFDIKLVATSNQGCKDSMTYASIEIFELPKSDFNSNPGCLYDSLVLTNKSTINTGSLSHSWDLGDSNTNTSTDLKHLYASAGSYKVTLTTTSNKGCKAISTQNVFINHRPLASFTVDTVCEGNDNSFANTSTISKGTIANYQWTFGDGFSSGSISPSHQYGASGFFNAILVAASDSGCTDTAVAVAGVNPNPNTDFDVSNVCLGDKLSPVNNTSITSGSIASWNWNFDDGNSSTASSPQNTYTSKGTYNVKLVATSNQGCMDSTVEQVIVDNIIVAGFNTANVCLGDTMFFTNTTNTSCGTVTGYQWSFGDGNASTAKDPFRKYSSSGTFDVRLIVIQSGGDRDTITKSVTVFPQPKPSLFASNECEGEQIQFQNLSTISSGSIVSNVWSFGDGTKSSDKNPKYTYTQNGAYDVTLITTSNNGCIDSTTQSLSIYEAPEVEFQFSDVCNGKDVDFTNQSSLSTGTMSYSWSFGDGFSSTQTSPSYKYASTGTYTVELKVTTDKFCESTLSKKVRVFDVPTVGFNWMDTCETDEVLIQNTSSIKSGSLTYAWDLGDGNKSSSANPAHSFATFGTYNVKLKAMSGEGCSDSITQSIKIFEKAKASFTYAGSCPGEDVVFTNTSTSTQKIAGIAWEFNGSDISTSAKPKYTFSGSGPHTTVLFVLTEDNCLDTAKQTIRFKSVPLADFSFNNACERDTVFFTNASTLSVGTLSSKWDFGDGNTSTDLSPSHIYMSSQSFDVKLIVESDKGCKDSMVQSVFALDKPEVDFTVDGGCLGDTTYFANKTTDLPDNKYTWRFDGIGNTSTSYDGKFRYPSANSYDVTLLVENTHCSDSMTQSIAVATGPTNLDFSFRDTCARSKVTFNNLTTNPNLTYKWQFFDGTFSTAKSPEKAYTKPGRYPVGFTASEGDCADSTYKMINIHAFADSSFSFTSLGIRTVKFEAMDSTSYSYSWNFDDGTTSAQYAPKHTFTADGTYDVSLTVTTPMGCSNTSVQRIVIKGNSISWNDDTPLIFDVYPNPFSDFVISTFELEETERVKIVVYNEVGQEVITALDAPVEAGKHQLPIIQKGTDLRTGVYYVKMMVGDEFVIRKLIRTK